jgi:hypothetical protein
MTGDDLVTMVTEAATDQAARAAADQAPAGVVRDAADLLYIDPDFTVTRLRSLVVREARA